MIWSDIVYYGLEDIELSFGPDVDEEEDSLPVLQVLQVTLKRS